MHTHRERACVYKSVCKSLYIDCRRWMTTRARILCLPDGERDKTSETTREKEKFKKTELTLVLYVCFLFYRTTPDAEHLSFAHSNWSWHILVDSPSRLSRKWKQINHRCSVCVCQERKKERKKKLGSPLYSSEEGDDMTNF